MLKVTEDTLVGSVPDANALVSSAFSVQTVTVPGGVMVVVPTIGPGALTVSVAVAPQPPPSRHTAPVVNDHVCALATPGARNVTPPSTSAPATNRRITPIVKSPVPPVVGIPPHTPNRMAVHTRPTARSRTST